MARLPSFFLAGSALLDCAGATPEKHWVQRIHEEMDRTWCDPKIGWLHKAMHKSGPRQGEFKWARTWHSSHGEWKNYALVWHELVPHLVVALEKATSEMVGSSAQHHESLRQLAQRGDVYAFGVAQGHNLEILHDILPKRRLYGFDSFLGLPAEDDAGSRIAAWKEGDFKARATPEAIARAAGGSTFAKVFSGFFNETLTPALAAAEHMRPAIFLDVDCDLHASTVSVLDWAFTQRIARVGTLIGYDDFWTVPCDQHRKAERAAKSAASAGGTAGASHGLGSPLLVGEGKAHLEMTQKHGLRFECVGGPCRVAPTLTSCHKHNGWAPIFVVTAVGSPDPDPGFNFTESMREFMSAHKTCRTLG